MNWARVDRWYAESDVGYRIVFSRLGDAWVYLCYGPPRPGWREALKVRYAQGETMPRERELLGRATTAEEARAICDQHWGDSGHVAAG